MAIKNILVDFNGSEHSKSALRLARLLMHEHDAHLTGALTFTSSKIGTTLHPYASQDLNRMIEQAEGDRRRAIHAEFFDCIGPESAERIHWVEKRGDVDFSLVDLAHSFDIVLIGQYSATPDSRHLAPHQDLIALNSGRPVLVVPDRFNGTGLDGKVLLAWDGGRAAARALADALPLIGPQNDVSVVSVGAGTAEMLEHLARVVEHLKRHGIAAESEIIPRSNRSIGKVLMDEAERQGARLLVMGAYEHAKFFEDIWGGATHSAINNASIPILLSH